MRPTGQSLRNYVTVAAMCMSLLTGTMPQYYDPTTMSHKRIFLHPYLHERIMQRSIWSKPEQLKEPFTYRMLADHARVLLKKPKAHSCSFVGLDYAVWDWLRLGVFTGSRLSEYAQSSHFVRVSRSLASTVPPPQIRRPGGASLYEPMS